MRSASREPSSRTLMGRVALVAALAAFGGGFFAAIAAVTLAEIRVEQSEDRRLTEEAIEIVSEIDGLSNADLATHLDKEVNELEKAGLRLAIRRDGQFIGGDPQLPVLAPGCITRDTRVCVAKNGFWSVAVAANDVPTLGGAITLGIVSGAAIFAALLGALASRRLARWAMGPLVRLGERVVHAPMDKSTDLGANEGVLEIDTLRKTLRNLLDRRAEALSSARLFAAGAAHELRTPLTTLSGELELLAEESLPEPVRERIDGLQQSTARIVQLVERLLIVARVGASEAMRHDAVELDDVLQDVCRRAFRGHTERVTYEARKTPVVRGDEALLSILFENALLNALVHAAPAQVQVILDEIDEQALIYVIDKGPGIAPEDRVRLFEPFQRGMQSASGAGLGLALVGQIARAHGGEARFVDHEGGAHLRICLPRWTPRRAEESTN